MASQVTAVLDDNPDTNLEIDQILAALAIFGIGASARDNNVNSKEAGAE